MQSTRLSVLEAARSGSEPGWTRLVELYQPLIYGWLQRQGVSHHDAEELTQDVMSTLVKEVPEFAHSGRTGAFRHWLRQITINRAKGFWRSGKLRTEVGDNGNFFQIVQQLKDPHSQLSQLWDREHDDHVLRQLMREVEASFEAATMIAFRRQVFEGAAAETVAEELGMSVGAVYSAKSRVLRNLRLAAQGLLDTATADVLS